MFAKILYNFNAFYFEMLPNSLTFVIMNSQTNNSCAKQQLISFIVTYHNEPVEMLRQCLESILALSLSDAEREIVLVDDGSDVCPLNEISDLIDHLLYLRKPCEGVSVARNLGIQASSGTYLQFVDADDYLIRNAYEHSLDLVRYHNPDIVLFYLTDKPEADTPFVLPTPVSGAEYLHRNNLRGAACGYVFKRMLLHNLRFTPGVRYGEDEEFTAQLIVRCERVFATEDRAYFYRKHKSQVTSQKDKRSIAQRLNDTEAVIFRLYEKAEHMPEVERLSLRRRIDQLTMDYIFNTIRLTRDWKNLCERTSRLHDRGLYPLPLQRYTKKYYTFARMSASKLGLRLLFAAIIATKH